LRSPLTISHLPFDSVRLPAIVGRHARGWANPASAVVASELQGSERRGPRGPRLRVHISLTGGRRLSVAKRSMFASMRGQPDEVCRAGPCEGFVDAHPLSRRSSSGHPGRGRRGPGSRLRRQLPRADLHLVGGSGRVHRASSRDVRERGAQSKSAGLGAESAAGVELLGFHKIYELVDRLSGRRPAFRERPSKEPDVGSIERSSRCTCPPRPRPGAHPGVRHRGRTQGRLHRRRGGQARAGGRPRPCTNVIEHA